MLLLGDADGKKSTLPVDMENISLFDTVLYIYTLPETNIAAENRPSQKEINLPTIHFQVRC